MNLLFASDFMKTKQIYFLIYLIIINAYGFFIMMIDKYYAKKNKWRVRERKIFLVAFAGGALGIFSGMKAFRHKTQHKSFSMGIPLIFVLHILLIVFAYVKAF